MPLGDPSLFRMLGVRIGVSMFRVVPPIADLPTCFLNLLGSLPCQFLSFLGRFVGILTRLVSRLVGLFFPRATIVGNCGAVTGRSTYE
jgi:hypothetical protein